MSRRAGTATLTTKSGVYFLNRAMDFINANIHKAFEEIENIGALLQNLQLYSVFIDSAPIGNLPGMMGVIFYYYDIYDEVWLLFYEDLVYEWLKFEEGIDSIWYDHTQDESFYGKDDPDDFTDVTDYIYPGENTITFYHYTEGDGSGMVVKVYY